MILFIDYFNTPGPRYRWSIVSGLLLFLAAIFISANALSVSLAIAWLSGCFLLIVGLFVLLSAISSQTREIMGGAAAISLLSLMVGLLFVLNPSIALVCITAMTACVMLAVGVLMFIVAMGMRPMSGWRLVASLAAICTVLGLVIGLGLYGPTLGAVALLLAANLLLCGIGLIAVGLHPAM